jgi:hypothetical protein
MIPAAPPAIIPNDEVAWPPGINRDSASPESTLSASVAAHEEDSHAVRGDLRERRRLEVPTHRDTDHRLGEHRRRPRQIELPASEEREGDPAGEPGEERWGRRPDTVEHDSERHHAHADRGPPERRPPHVVRPTAARPLGEADFVERACNVVQAHGCRGGVTLDARRFARMGR